MKNKVMEQILKEDQDNLNQEYNFVFHDQKYLVK